VVALIRSHRDVKLLVEVEGCLRLAAYSPGRIEFAPTENAPRDLAARLAARLQSWTGARWAVSVVAEADAPTIAETRDAEKLEMERNALDHPLVAAVFAAFPKARITEIRTREALTQEAAIEALPEVEDEWDPFEDD
jgi:DNA polymerase-3 subunit gamma/tau